MWRTTSEFDLVVLQDDTANQRLKTGDVGTILTVYGDGKAFEPGRRCGRVCYTNRRVGGGRDVVAAPDQNGEGVGGGGRSGYDKQEDNWIVKF